MSAPREDRLALGVALAALAFFCFAWVDTSAKILAGMGLPVLVIAFFRYGINFLFVLLWFVPREGRAALVSTVPKMQILRALFLLSSTVLNFWALSYLPLTTTIPIFFAMPLVVCLLSVPLLGERVGIRRYLAVVIGFVGVMMIIRPTGLTFHWAMLISVTATVTGSLYFIMTRMVAGRDDMPVGQVFTSGVATMVLLPLAWIFWQTPETVAQTGLLILAGAAAAIGHSVLTIAYRYGEAAQLTPVVYTEIIAITLISWLVFNEVPDMWTALGTAVIIGSGLYVWMRERKLA